MNSRTTCSGYSHRQQWRRPAAAVAAVELIHIVEEEGHTVDPRIAAEGHLEAFDTVTP